MDVKVYYMNTSNVPALMVVAKTDLLFGNNNFQVETVDDSAAETAGYTGLSGVIIEQLDYNFQQMVSIVQAAHTQAFAGATNHGFKLTIEDEHNQQTLLNTKTT